MLIPSPQNYIILWSTAQINNSYILQPPTPLQCVVSLRCRADLNVLYHLLHVFFQLVGSNHVGGLYNKSSHMHAWQEMHPFLFVHNWKTSRITLFQLLPKLLYVIKCLFSMLFNKVHYLGLPHYHAADTYEQNIPRKTFGRCLVKSCFYYPFNNTSMKTICTRYITFLKCTNTVQRKWLKYAGRKKKKYHICFKKKKKSCKNKWIKKGHAFILFYFSQKQQSLCMFLLRYVRGAGLGK